MKISVFHKWAGVGEAVAAHDSGKILCLKQFHLALLEAKLKVSLLDFQD